MAGLADAPLLAPLAGRQESPAASAVLSAVHDLREALAATLYGMLAKPRDLAGRQNKVLEGYFVQADQHRELAWHPASGRTDELPCAAWIWGRFERNLKLPVWIVAQSAAALLTSEAIARVHMCGSETCRWLFLDSSKNQSRRIGRGRGYRGE